MLYSQFLINTKKSVSQEIECKSHELALRASLVTPLAAGLYSFLPLGQKVLQKIEILVRNEMNAIGCLEVSLPIVQPLELWARSGRIDTYGQEMLRFKNRELREFCFGPTHEEVISDVVSGVLESYKQLPFTLYQISRKFRDEKRPRHGLLRCRDFLMKDAYSFDQEANALQERYEIVRKAYQRIFSTLSLRYVIVNADPGEIGGSGSEEFLAYGSNGEDKFFIDSNERAIKVEYAEQKGISPGTYQTHLGVEIGHIFQLGQTYAEKMGISFLDNEGKKKHPYMGCYGIGISRLVSTIIDQHHDEDGIVWPKSIAPFQLIIIPIKNSDAIEKAAFDLYQKCQDAQIEVLLDDRRCSPGVKFKDANLIGIPLRVIIRESTIDDEKMEIERRDTFDKKVITLANVVPVCQRFYINDSF